MWIWVLIGSLQTQYYPSIHPDYFLSINLLILFWNIIYSLWIFYSYKFYPTLPTSILYNIMISIERCLIILYIFKSIVIWYLSYLLFLYSVHKLQCDSDIIQYILYTFDPSLITSSILELCYSLQYSCDGLVYGTDILYEPQLHSVLDLVEVLI